MNDATADEELIAKILKAMDKHPLIDSALVHLFGNNKYGHWVLNCDVKNNRYTLPDGTIINKDGEILDDINENKL